MHYYALESIQNVSDVSEDLEDGLGHMTDKPLKNGQIDQIDARNLRMSLYKRIALSK